MNKCKKRKVKEKRKIKNGMMNVRKRRKRMK